MDFLIAIIAYLCSYLWD